ncbi:imidazoleglycerol-phosphate dehydratase [Myxococcus xanthus DK 1622]|uniref:Imidazoleglycerol-phosphate dehydratase n=1 Tax=Myxococcus xanthus (strain DK1622) TaxID=246197 RepID=Q1D4M3_MYXXD|nr:MULTISPECIES: imidazoleglycerol-phosphate dehydratase [Myxococcus]ABF87311.1 imidazoleglycerol-phosphate dehydratase [Myxococcus xanthus DK 1622]NOJ53906.1 imidazoleglycerol-phosphate dehydratase [Myxococcus xanthus]QPM76822.1 imidazoleglycerol-phosphate dehydratase [Myxococcus xanthus]QVW65889.1 imidazoleglycerol-phosphate dehydratase [Myxococcus xanthus DZ2]QZZ51912.1 Imidazoleglycerol-phosphate dehydratase [Myxococcus xanthus]
MTTVIRETKETQVRVELAPGKGVTNVDTGLKFFDHMLATFARYAGLDLSLHARGDLTHHVMEDVAITLGTAVQQVIPATAARFAERTIPMDDALVQACLDAGGRFYYQGPLKNRLYEHWMRSFSEHARVTLHLRVLRGKDSHHATEASFKALGLALRDAMVDSGSVFSMKGSVSLEVK